MPAELEKCSVSHSTVGCATEPYTNTSFYVFLKHPELKPAVSADVKDKCHLKIKEYTFESVTVLFSSVPVPLTGALFNLQVGEIRSLFYVAVNKEDTGCPLRVFFHTKKKKKPLQAPLLLKSRFQQLPRLAAPSCQC